MSFVKRVFQRLLSSSPNGRSKSESRNGNKTEQTVLSTDSKSKSGNSLELPTSKQLSPIKETSDNNANGPALQEGHRRNRFRSHELPELVSLAAARKRFYEIHHSSDKGRNIDPASIKSYIFKKLNQQEDYKPLDISNQSNEPQTKPPNSDRKIIRTIHRKGSVPITRTPESKEGLNFRSKVVSKSSILDENSVRPFIQPRQDFNEQQSQNQPKELPGGSSASTKSSSSHAVDQIFARNEAYVQKNRQDLAKALKNIEQKDNEANRRKVPPLPIPNTHDSTPVQSSGSQSGRNQSQSFDLPDIHRKGSQRNEHPKPPCFPRQKIKAELSVVEEGLNSAAAEDKNRMIKSKLEKIESELKQFDQKKPEPWRRVEIKPEGMDQRVSTFENEIEKVESLARRNSHALADLVVVRENLMHLYLKEDLKTHRNRRKLLKINH